MNKILRAGIGYTIANILIKGIGFFTLPIFARLLMPEDFGRYNIFMAYESILFCFIGFALHTSLRSANREFDIDEYTSSVTLVYILQFAICIVLCCCLSPVLEKWTGFQYKVLILLLMASFGSSLIHFYNERVAIEYSYKKYFVVMALTSLVNICLSLILMLTVFNDNRFFGRVLGVGVSFFLVGLIIISLLWKKCSPRVSRAYWSFGANYSLPVVFHGIFQIVLMQAGCLLIQKLVSNTAAGMYALGLTFISIIMVLITSVSTVWSTFYFEVMAKNSSDGRKKLQDAAKAIAFFFFLLTLGLSSIAPELLLFLGGRAYSESAYSVYGILVCAYLIALYNLIAVGEYYAKKTKALLVCTMIGAAACILFNWFGIERFGYISVAYSTSLAYVIYVALHWCICLRLFRYSVVSANFVLISVAILYFECWFNFCFTKVLEIRLIVTSAVLLATFFFCKKNKTILKQLFFKS